MKNIRLLLSVLAIALTSGGYVHAGNLNNNTITSVSFNSTGFFLSASNWANPGECDKTNAVVLLNTDANYDKAYALLLAAYISGKVVTGYSDGCTTHDGLTYNTIRGTKYLVVQ